MVWDNSPPINQLCNPSTGCEFPSHERAPCVSAGRGTLMWGLALYFPRKRESWEEGEREERNSPSTWRAHRFIDPPALQAMASESSSSTDEDEEHNAALRSVAIDSNAVLQFAMPSAQGSGFKSRLSKFSSKRSARVLEDDDDTDGDGTGGLKLYQTRVQDLLQKHLDKVFEESLAEVAVESENAAKSGDHGAEDETYDEEIRLYRDAPLGVTLKRSRPLNHFQVKQLPQRYDSSDDDLTEKESRFHVAAVEGSTIISQAEKAQANAFARFLAAEEASQRADKAEAERIGHLRRERGEEWLPSIAKEFMSEVRQETHRRKAMSSEGKIGVVAKYRI